MRPEIRSFVYYADQSENNRSLVEQVVGGEFVQVYGPRASGKSSRIIDAMSELDKRGYQCI